MAEIQTYPAGTPVAGDLVPYVSDPAGTPALKLADASALGGGGLFDVDGSNTNTLIVTGTAETVLRTVTSAASVALVFVGASISQNDPGVPKSATVRLRQTGLAGAVLWAASTGGGMPDIITGDHLSYSATVYDASPTGSWVLTVQETSGSGATQIWSASSVLAIVAQ